jgi:hypothetical protein
LYILAWDYEKMAGYLPMLENCFISLECAVLLVLLLPLAGSTEAKSVIICSGGKYEPYIYVLTDWVYSR